VTGGPVPCPWRNQIEEGHRCRVPFMMGEELARCYLGAMLRARRGRYYCARCLARLLGSASWTRREARRAIAVFLQRPVGLRIRLARRRHRCEDCGQAGRSLLGSA
jgi:hypothetical protein